MPDALHSIRSLLCTATNTTPHERLFNFPRRSMNGESIPIWLSNPGPVFLKRYVRRSKYEPLVDKVELIESNPNYAHIRYPNGREDTVSLRDLAPIGNTNESVEGVSTEVPTENVDTNTTNDLVPQNHIDDTTINHETLIPEPEIRRSHRNRRSPQRLDL